MVSQKWFMGLRSVSGRFHIVSGAFQRILGDVNGVSGVQQGFWKYNVVSGALQKGSSRFKSGSTKSRRAS